MRFLLTSAGIKNTSIHDELLPENTMASAERWAAGIAGPAYAIDDETPIRVVDGTVEVVSEGHWKLFTSPDREQATAARRTLDGSPTFCRIAHLHRPRS